MTVQAEDQPNVPWCTRAQVLGLPWFQDLGDVAGSQLDTLCMVASCWLWRATGRRFSGPATTTVRPVGQCSTGGLGRTLTWAPAETFDSRTGRYGYGWLGARGEGALEVLLGHTPVRSVTQVVIDGQVLPAVDADTGQPAYRVDDGRWLVRCDGETWPAWQTWERPSAPGAGGDQTGTWEVTLIFGADPPPDGVYAAEVLTGELALAALASSSCRLPSRVQSVARQGTNMLLVDPQILLAGDRWGVSEVDMFVSSVNPAGLVQAATITSPDVPRAIRRAGTQPGS